MLIQLVTRIIIELHFWPRGFPSEPSGREPKVSRAFEVGTVTRKAAKFGPKHHHCIPRDPISLSVDDWGVQSPSQQNIEVPLPLLEGDWIPRVCCLVDILVIPSGNRCFFHTIYPP